MKYRFLFVALLPFMYLSLHAQNRHGMLGVDTEDKKVEMVVSYEFRSGIDAGKGRASLVIQDGCFRLESNGFEVYSDGKSCWTVNPSARELVVDNAITIDMNASPKQLLEILGMNPDRSDVDVVYGADGALSTMKATLHDGTQLSLTVRSIKTSARGDISVFTYDEGSIGPRWVVTDLRAD